MQVQSLALLSGLRIWCCSELWCRSPTWLDPALLWLWCRLVAATAIWPLTWELPCATDAPLKWKKKVCTYVFQRYLPIIFFFLRWISVITIKIMRILWIQEVSSSVPKVIVWSILNFFLKYFLELIANIFCVRSFLSLNVFNYPFSYLIDVGLFRIFIFLLSQSF